MYVHMYVCNVCMCGCTVTYATYVCVHDMYVCTSICMYGVYVRVFVTYVIEVLRVIWTLCMVCVTCMYVVYVTYVNVCMFVWCEYRYVEYCMRVCSYAV